MKKKPVLNFRFLSLCLVTILMVASPGLGQSIYEREEQDSKGIHFVLRGGYAHMESRDGLVDLHTEIQLQFSSLISAGFGVGYMSDSDARHSGGFMGGTSGGFSGGMMGSGMMGPGFDGMSGGLAGHDHTFRVIPLTLSLYYTLPAGARFDLFMFGGVGYYVGSFRDITSQDQNAFGPHLGIGLGFEVAPRIALVADALYRFVNLKGFTSELHPGFRESLNEMGEHREEGSWHLHPGIEEWHFHENNQGTFQEQALQDAGDLDLSLNGFSLRAGLKFKL